MDGQMAFADVTEMEVLRGDQRYTEWVALGRPKLTEDEFLKLLALPPRPADVPVLAEYL